MTNQTLVNQDNWKVSGALILSEAKNRLHLAIFYWNVLCLMLVCLLAPSKASWPPSLACGMIGCQSGKADYMITRPSPWAGPSWSIKGVSVHTIKGAISCKKLCSHYKVVLTRTLIGYCDSTVSSMTQVLFSSSVLLALVSQQCLHHGSQDGHLNSQYHIFRPESLAECKLYVPNPVFFPERKVFPEAPRRLPLTPHWPEVGYTPTSWSITGKENGLLWLTWMTGVEFLAWRTLLPDKCSY